MAKGGLGPRIKGDNFERAVCQDQERIGRWARRLRQGVGEVVDVISLGQDSKYMIQAKVGGYMTPIEREQLVMAAQSVGAVPMMAFKANGEIHYKVLSLWR